MLDTQTSPLDGTPPAWQSGLSHGDVVLFRYPVADGDGAPPKARPCLVMDVITIAGTRLITLAYGTTAYSNANRGREIHATRPEAMRAAGLDRPTRFVGARRITVSAGHPGFVLGKEDSPVLGRLGAAEFEHMNTVRARLQAEADIAADRRSERRQRRRPERREVARPIVEYRHPRRKLVLPLRPGTAA